jgi:hypothetical protein
MIMDVGGPLGAAPLHLDDHRGVGYTFAMSNATEQRISTLEARIEELERQQKLTSCAIALLALAAQKEFPASVWHHMKTIVSDMMSRRPWAH